MKISRVAEAGGIAVEIQNTIEIPAPPDRVWAYLLDVERVVPCMPGAEITEVVDDRTWKGKVAIKLGPVSLAFAGTVVLQEQDENARRVVLKADGKEVRGKGSASALVTSRLEDTDGTRTRVVILADLSITGAIAQFGRGMIADVSQRMAGQFAECLAARMAAEATTLGEGAPVPGEVAAELPRAAASVGGIRLALWALLRALGRLGRSIVSVFRR
jgi:carbon monoxide dehydrogenase subunit G